MAGIASGPPVLNTESYYVHPTFSKCDKRSLIARIQFFSGNIVHRMNDAQFIMLPQATSVASMTRSEVNRVRSSEMLEDHLKKKLGRQYSTYLDLPDAESASEAESVSDPESDGASTQNPIKQLKKTNTLDLETLKLNARPQPRSTMRRANKFTQTELRQLEKYIALHPPDENDNGRPNGGWWVKLCEDCEWARTHTHMSWRTWSCRHWNKWAKETADRRKALAKASGSAHLVKASSSRQKKGETIELSSSESSPEGEGEEQGPQEIPGANTVEESQDDLEARTSNANDERPKPQDRHDVASPAQRRDRPTDTETEPTEEEDAPQPEKALKQANQPPTVIVRPLSSSLPPPAPSQPHLGFACWRRRPRVLVADSDPSQATATTTTTQTTNLPPTQFTQPTSASAIPAAQKSRILTQSSASTSQHPQTTQSQRGSQVASASGSGSGSSGRNPWIAPDVEDSDDDYNATHHTFDADSDDDGWSENSSENATDDEEPESLLTGTAVRSGLPAATRKRSSSALAENAEGAGFRKLVDLHLPGYFERAVLEYGETQPPTQAQFQTQATQQSQSQSVTAAAGSSQSRIALSSQEQQKRRRLVNAVLSLVSHWMQIPLPKVRNVWKSLPREKRTFEELQKKCLQCDLSTSRKEYEATGLFTQRSPRSRVRKWGDGGRGGPARKRRRLETFPTLSRDGSSNTEADFDELDEEDEESEVYFGGQDPDAPTGGYQDDDGADQEPPPILFRQTRMIPGSAKILHPYPAQPDKEWAKRICRVLAARYEWRRASKVYEIWEEVGGDAKRVEKALKEVQKSLVQKNPKDKSVSDQKTLLDLGLGDIPRPWA